jgi:hypothetical protein
VDIIVYETDSVQDIERRLRCTGLLSPLFVFLPLDFSTKEFLEKPRSFPLLDLAEVFKRSEKSPATALPKDYVSFIKEKYSVPLATFLQYWVFYELMFRYHNIPPQNRNPVLMALKTNLTGEMVRGFTTPLAGSETGQPVNRVVFLSRLTPEWLETAGAHFTQQSTKEKEKNAEAIDIGVLMAQQVPVETSPLHEMGKITLLDLCDTTVTTGILFDRLVLNEELCVAGYKSFYKIFTRSPIVKPQSFEDRSPDFYSLSVYSKDGKLSVHVADTETGIRVQCVLSNESILRDKASLFRFLRIEQDAVVGDVSEKSAGLLAEFTIDNPSPYPDTLDAPRWAAFQAPLLANLIMNDRVFSKFFSVNDTDKISRQNHSLYIYFYSPFMTDTPENIYLTGWNRLSSRFGDLTAILTPLHLKKGDYKIHVKITRSTSRDVVERFHSILSRLLRFYNSRYEQQVTLFESAVPGYRPVSTPVSVSNVVGETLTDIDPVMFPSNVYVRKCQNPSPLIISAEQAAALPEERKLLFPPTPVDGIQPRWYTCPTEPFEKDGKTYRYPGLIKLPRIPHPFHAAPCCYIEPHADKNRATIQAIMEKKRGVVKPDNIVWMPKTKRLKSDKIINNTGQLGELPPTVARFFSILVPLAEFSRVGVPSEGWDPVLAALEYVYGVREKQKVFRSEKTLRTMLLQENLDITLQQNYDIGTDGVATILRENEYIDPTRFWKLLENFYRVSLFILRREEDQTLRIVRPRFVRSYAWTLVPTRPMVFLYQHFGGSTDSMNNDGFPRCEVIGYVPKGSDQLMLETPFSDKLQHLVQLAIATFSGDRLNTPVRLPARHPMTMSLDSQVVDGLGKTRVLLFTEARYPAVLLHPMAPLKLPVLTQPLFLPTMNNVVEFLTACRATILEAQHFKKEYVFLHVNVFTPMVLVARYSVGVLPVEEVQEVEEEPPFLQYLLPDPPSLFSNMNRTQRFAGVLQDYMLLLLSEYIRIHQGILTTKGIHDIVDSFLQEKIVYQDDYREPEALSPLADQNPSLFCEERLRLPTALREKTPFFLRWYMSVKPEDLVRMRNNRVLPSFFQNIDDFTPRLYHIIQKSITPIQTYTNYPFLHDPLDSLPPLEKNKVYYYYNVKETPQKHPYILVLSASKTDLLRMANHYLVQGKNLQSKGSPIQSYWAKEGSSWVPTGTDPRAAIVPRAPDFYGLFPFQG